LNADAKTEREHFFKRNDAFFVDYNFVGLLVQQNYLKVVQGRYSDAKLSKDDDKIIATLEQMSAAADSMSDFAHAENALRGDQNWSLLPFTAMLAVKTGFHAGGANGGFLPGYPEFTTWLGRNSTKGKKSRLLQELQHHANYKISGGMQALRMSYLPVFHERFMSLLSSGGAGEAIDLMDEYGFDRDDIFEKLDEFTMDTKAQSFSKLDSKKKAAFTRAYNEGIHKSQALVAEQGGAKKLKRKPSSAPSETAELDAIDDDHVGTEEEEEEEDDDLNAEKIKDLFKSSKRKGKSSGKGSKGKATGKKKK
jgi:replication factor C subunit 1